MVHQKNVIVFTLTTTRVIQCLHELDSTEYLHIHIRQ